MTFAEAQVRGGVEWPMQQNMVRGKQALLKLLYARIYQISSHGGGNLPL